MFDLDAWAEIFATLRKNRLRTWLTGLGVFLGILILLFMVGFGQALELGVKGKMGGFAANAVFMWGQRTSEPYAGRAANRQVAFDNADIEALQRVPGIQHLAPRNQLGGFREGSNVRRGTKVGNFQVSGDYPAFQYVQTPLMKAGRFINDADIVDRRKVCAIGTGVVDQLFVDGSDPIGQYIEAFGIYFQVVGVFGTRQKGQQGERALNAVHIPFTTFQQAFHYGDKVGWFAIAGEPSASAATIEERVRQVLAERHRIAPTDENAIGSFNAGREFKKVRSTFEIINKVMWFAGLMTLAAGVIGVSNIMLISVRERTKELGVRKALGATPGRIVRMIVSEAVVLTAIAGYLGIVAGTALLEVGAWLIAKAGDDVPFGPPSVSLTLAASAGVVIVAFGALAGVIPALHAAKIQPVEALRTE